MCGSTASTEERSVCKATADTPRFMPAGTSADRRIMEFCETDSVADNGLHSCNINITDKKTEVNFFINLLFSYRIVHINFPVLNRLFFVADTDLNPFIIIQNKEDIPDT